MSDAEDQEELDRLAEEFLDRFRAGQRPTVSEYLDRYQDLADDIRDLFPTLLLMEDVAAGSEPRVEHAEQGDRLGEYRIIREVGRGGMGVVYEAEQVSLGRRVALKVLNHHRLLDESILERFRREAQAAARLHHTNIVPVFGVGEQDGVHYFAMQFIRGRGLDEIIEELKKLERDPASGAYLSPPSEMSGDDTAARNPYYRRVAQIGLRLAEALAYAHKEGVLHRDVKPSNILLDAKGSVWITDFGLAKAEGSDNLTQTGDIVGTLTYMAPERFQGWADPRSDVYSLGLTLYELLALRQVFDPVDRRKLLQMVAEEDPTPLRRLERRIPRDLETIVMKAIAKEPGRRYRSANQLAKDLRRFLSSEPIRARPSATWERWMKWARRRPYRAIVAVAVGVSPLVLGAAWLYHWGALNSEIEERKSGQADAQARLQESQGRVQDFAWTIVRHPGLAPADYARALAWAETACARDPGNDRLKSLLGSAQVRCGDLASAIATLRDADARNCPRPTYPRVYDLAFLAMAHHRRGERAEADRVLREMRAALPQAGADDDARRLADEAIDLVSTRGD